MKKIIMLFFVTGIMLACSGGNKKASDSAEVNTAKPDTLVQKTQEMEGVMNASQTKMDSLQNDIDSLLNEK